MKNRALIALITIVAAVFGSLALTSLKQELIPSLQLPQLLVSTSYPGASPEVVNDDVGAPIETAIQGLEGLETTTTTSSTNASLVSATFTYGTDLVKAESRMSQAINRIKATLPDGLDPQVISGSIDDFPVISLAVAGGDNATLADELRRSVLGDIRDVDGVREAALVGDVGQRITITPNVDELTMRGLSTQAIRDALEQNGSLIPAGAITEGDTTLSVQAGSKLGSVNEIAALPVIGAVTASLPAATPTAAPSAAPTLTTIGDIAAVALVDNPVASVSRVNGEPALTIAVTKVPAANTVDVSNAVREILPRLEDAIAGSTFTVVFDQAPFIQESIDALTQEGILGLVFAVLVILVFLLSVRATLVTAISIPTSVLITFVGLQFVGYSLNILTLGALTIAIGRVVDDSIVVIENIKRHLVAGSDRAQTIVEAVREVAGAITASTITTVTVFLPISFVGGSTGELFRPFALTVTIALLASLLVALTIVPVLAYWFLRAPKPAIDRSVDLRIDRSVDRSRDPVLELAENPGRLQRGYLPIIGWTLRHSVATLLLAVLVLGGTVALLPFMKVNFLGSTGQDTFRVSQVLPVGTSLAAQDAASVAVDDALRDLDGVSIVQVSIGGSNLQSAFRGGAPSTSTVSYSVTTDDSVDADTVQDRARIELNDLDGAGEITIAASDGFGSSSDIDITVTAQTDSDLQIAADDILAAVARLEPIEQSTSNLAASRPNLAVTIDRTAAAEAGLSELALGTLVSQAMQPSVIGSIVIDERSLSVYLQTDAPPTTAAELAALPITTRTGTVALDTLATIAQVDGPSNLTTTKGLRTATVSATPNSDDLGTANAEITAALERTALPSGATAELGGVSADQTEAFEQLGIAMLVAILIVYIVMVATFRSLLQPLLLLVSVPFAATGAIALQVITGIPLGVPSLIGVLMLIGIVVTNAIVLVDLVNQYRRRGQSVHDAVVNGASRRLRPILMTALATIFALLPMAVGLTGQGGFISQPLALVVIGGLVSSTLLTLVVLPVLYFIVESPRERRALARSRTHAASASRAM